MIARLRVRPKVASRSRTRICRITLQIRDLRPGELRSEPCRRLLRCQVEPRPQPWRSWTIPAYGNDRRGGGGGPSRPDEAAGSASTSPTQARSIWKDSGLPRGATRAACRTRKPHWYRAKDIAGSMASPPAPAAHPPSNAASSRRTRRDAAFGCPLLNERQTVADVSIRTNV